MNGKRLLITGIAGFVARHFIEYLYENKINLEVVGIDMQEPKFDLNQFLPYVSIKYFKVNMVNADEVKAVFEDFIPDYILHLASYSSVAYSWNNPAESFLNNTNIFLNLTNEVIRRNKDCRILSIGSSEEYGNVNKKDLPICEHLPLSPNSPYAVARVSQELLSKVFVDAYGLKIVLTRSFNHIGPRQDERFVVPSFIKRILEIYQQGKTEGEIEVGDISVIRDFIDVRDVVRAYYLLLIKGNVGEIYNICAGRRVLLKDLINLISTQIGVTVNVKVNKEFIRPSDNKEIVGSYEKIKREIDWEPSIKLQDTIKDMIEWYKNVEA